MKFDDPSLLTAYLDDELSPAERSRVELALAANPRLQRELAEMARVRDALCELPAALPARSVASDVAEAIADLSPQTLRLETQTRVAMLWVAVGVIAASFVLAWSMQLIQLRDAGVRRGLMQRPREFAAAEKHLPANVPTAIPQTALASSDLPPETLPTPPMVYVTEADLRQKSTEEQLRSLLGRADVKRLVVTLDSLAPDRVEKIDGLLHMVPRSDPVHARISLAPGISYDTDHPGDAVVFAAVLDDTEFANLQQRLEQHVGKAGLNEAPTPPSTIALLTEAHDITFSEVLPSSTTLAVGESNSAIYGVRMRDGGELPADAAPDPNELLRARSAPGSPGLLVDDRPRGGRPAARRNSAADTARSGRVSPEVAPRNLDSVIRRLDAPGGRLLDGAPAEQSRSFVCLIWVRAEKSR
jgi:hypothetical protein